MKRWNKTRGHGWVTADKLLDEGARGCLIALFPSPSAVPKVNYRPEKRVTFLVAEKTRREKAPRTFLGHPITRGENNGLGPKRAGGLGKK